MSIPRDAPENPYAVTIDPADVPVRSQGGRRDDHTTRAPRGVYERGSWVGVAADEPMCTAEKYLTDFQRFLTLDYHRQPHDGLVLPGASGVVQLGVGEDEGLEPKGPERAAVVGDDRDDRLDLTGLGVDLAEICE